MFLLHFTSLFCTTSTVHVANIENVKYYATTQLKYEEYTLVNTTAQISTPHHPWQNEVFFKLLHSYILPVGGGKECCFIAVQCVCVCLCVLIESILLYMWGGWCTLWYNYIQKHEHVSRMVVFLLWCTRWLAWHIRTWYFDFKIWNTHLFCKSRNY